MNLHDNRLLLRTSAVLIKLMSTSYTHHPERLLMRTTCSAFFTILLLSIGLPIAAHAQYDDFSDLSDLRRTLEFVGGEYADGYLQPMTDAFGANMHSGLFRNADVDAGFLPLIPIKLYVGINVSGVPTGSLSKTFAPPAEETLSDGTVVTFDGDRVPTVFGDTNTPDNATLTVREPGPDGEEFTIAAPPGLISTPIAPLVMPQLGIGTAFGTDAQIRYFPKSTLSAGRGSYGTVGLFGLALRHDLNQWIPAPLPLKLAVQGSYNQFTLENDFEVDGSTESQEVVNASGWAFNVHASRSIPLLPFTVYGGLQYERFTMDYSYTFNPSQADAPIGVELSQTAANRTRALAGLSFTFTFFHLNADYAVGGANNVLTTAIGLRL